MAWLAARALGPKERSEVEAMVEAFEAEQDRIEADGRPFAGAVVLGDSLARLRRLQAVSIGGGDGS